MKTFKQISSEAAKIKLAQEKITLLDIRDPASFARKHLPNAINLDKTNLQQFIEEAEKAQPVIVCCYHGFSSQQVAQYLIEKGFTEVYSLEGGFEGWK